MKVVIIGTGNVARVLGYKIKLAGHEIVQVIGRNASHTQTVAATLKAEPSINYPEMSQEAAIYLLAVSDAAIPIIAAQLVIPPNALLVHTAGAVPMEALAISSHHYGILYPLQSIQTARAQFIETPLLVDANSQQSLSEITDFAKTISPLVSTANNELRLRLHVAAVMVNNFTNYLFTVTAAYCKAEQLDFNLLLPLINETAARLTAAAPENLQTGPAIRHDQLTIDKHKKLLQQHPVALQLYELFTAGIQQWYAAVQQN